MRFGRVVILLWLIGSLFVSCRPRDILSRRQMQAVLVDLHKTEAILQVTGYASFAYEEEESKAYYLTLQKHNLTQAQFDSSLVWYTRHPQLFDKIYPKVYAQLEAEKNAFLEAHPVTREKQKPKPRDLPDLDETIFISIEGVILEGLDTAEKYKKMQKSEEKFVYVKIN